MSNPPRNFRLNLRWIFKMAWRDSRRSRPRLLLFGSSVILGVAALVAVHSLRDNLQANVDMQAAELLGADLEISGNKSPSPEIFKLMDSISESRSEQRSFASMIYFPRVDGSRLIQVRALEGEFPYYGKLDTDPVSAAGKFRDGRFALVDRSLMLQYEARVGDSIRIGDIHFAIAGSLLKAPGQTGLSASIAPVVYIPLSYLEETGLMKKGSRVSYTYYLKSNKRPDEKFIEEKVEPRLEAEGMDHETIESQKEDTGRSFEDLSRYLELVAFIALLMGCIGVGSAIHIYIREKINMIAVMRCLGASSAQAFLIYLIQITCVAAICSLAGAALGSVIQKLLPVLLEDLIPFRISASVSWTAVIEGFAIGMVIALLFALLPLVSVRNISPLNTIRLSFNERKKRFDPARWFIYLIILAFIFFLLNMQLHNPWRSMIFMGNLLLGLLVLTGISALAIRAARRFFPSAWSYVWRQGLSNLYRPNNQTLLLVVSVGFGTAFISTLFMVQSILINRISITASGDQPNIVLFDIQTPQKDQVYKVARQYGLPERPMVPIVNMRLEELNGLSAGNAWEDTTMERWGRLFSREYRVTYRDTLTPYEKITDGTWRGDVEDSGGKVFVSMEQGFASRHRIEIGDTLLFNVQGTLIETIVGSFREVDWNRIQTNFLVVFPKGVIENAPQFHVFLSHAPSADTSAAFQQAIVKQLPNISIIDLTLVLNILDDLMDKIGFVVRFIAAFSMITGLVVLIGSVMLSRYQRMQESVLLRTIGASRRHILAITAIEYLFLGALAGGTGIVISLGAGWALARFSFETGFTPALFPLAVIFLSICGITVIIGLVNSRGAMNKPPLEVLRRE